MAVRKRGSRGWTIDFRLPTGKRIRTRSPVQTRRDAEIHERWLRENWQRTGKPLPEPEPEKEEVTFGEFAEQFMTNWVAVHNRPSERAQKRSVLDRHLLPAIGTLPLAGITAKVLDEYAATKTGEGLNPNTVNHHLAVISKMLRVAEEWRLVEKVPRLRKLPVPPPKSDFLLPEEASRLVAAAEGEWRTAILVGLRAGLRIGEIIALRWDDVDQVAGRLRVRRSRWKDTEGPPKSGKEREVPLSDDLRDAMHRHRNLRGEYVFSQADGKPWTRDDANTGLWRACRKAGLRKVGWHVLRHSFASQLVMAGRSIKEVQELLGHADLVPTLRYAHLAPEAKRDAVRALDALARQPRPAVEWAETET